MSDEFNPDEYLAEKKKESEFNPDEYLSEKKKEASIKPEVSKLDTLVKSSGQGITAGLSDEGVGLGTVALDQPIDRDILPPHVAAAMGQGYDDFSLIEENKKLAKQGFKGDIGPTNPVDMYKQARDEERADIKRVSEANPITALAGNILGGIAATPLMPSTTFASPLLNAAVTGAGYGALAGFGSSEAESVPDMAIDTATGAALGAGTGAAMQGVVTGLSAGKDLIKAGAKKAGQVLDDKFPTLSEAYKEPLNISSPEYQQSVLKSQEETFSPAVKARIKEKQDTLLKLNEESDTLAKKIQDTQDRVAAKLKNFDASLKSAKDSSGQQVEEMIEGFSKKLGSYKKSIKDNYNKIDVLTKESGININIDDEISELESSLKSLEAPLTISGVNVRDINRTIKLLKDQFGTSVKGIDPITMQPIKSKGLSLSSFRTLREQIDNISSGNKLLMKPLKEFYAKTSQKRTQSLIDSGMQDIADQVIKNDAAYKNILQVEDSLGELGTIEAKNQLIPRFTSIASPESEKANSLLREFQQLKSNLPENLASDLEAGLDYTKLNKQALKEYEASMPTKQTLLDEAGFPELQTQAKAVESQIKPLQKEVGSEQSIKDLEHNLMTELKSGAKKLNLPETEAERANYQKILNEYKELTGKDITPDIKKLNTKTKILKSEGKTLEQNLENADLNRPGSYLAPSAPKVANTVGRLVRASDDKIQQLVQSLKSQNKPGLDHAADLISQSQGKTGAARVAPMFSAMQGSPELRKLIKKEDEKK